MRLKGRFKSKFVNISQNFPASPQRLLAKLATARAPDGAELGKIFRRQGIAARRRAWRFRRCHKRTPAIASGGTRGRRRRPIGRVGRTALLLDAAATAGVVWRGASSAGVIRRGATSAGVIRRGASSAGVVGGIVAATVPVAFAPAARTALVPATVRRVTPVTVVIAVPLVARAVRRRVVATIARATGRR